MELLRHNVQLAPMPLWREVWAFGGAAQYVAAMQRMNDLEDAPRFDLTPDLLEAITLAEVEAEKRMGARTQAYAQEVEDAEKDQEDSTPPPDKRVLRPGQHINKALSLSCGHQAKVCIGSKGERKYDSLYCTTCRMFSAVVGQ